MGATIESGQKLPQNESHQNHSATRTNNMTKKMLAGLAIAAVLAFTSAVQAQDDSTTLLDPTGNVIARTGHATDGSEIILDPHGNVIARTGHTADGSETITDPYGNVIGRIVPPRN